MAAAWFAFASSQSDPFYLSTYQHVLLALIYFFFLFKKLDFKSWGFYNKLIAQHLQQSLEGWQFHLDHRLKPMQIVPSGPNKWFSLIQLLGRVKTLCLQNDINYKLLELLIVTKLTNVTMSEHQSLIVQAHASANLCCFANWALSLFGWNLLWLEWLFWGCTEAKIWRLVSSWEL